MDNLNASQMLSLAADDVVETTFGRGASNEARRRVVIHRAAQLFETQGFHGTSVQDIADAVGITKAALYHYVNSKEQLLYEIHDAFVSKMLDAAKRFVAEHDSPEAQIRFFIQNIFETVKAYRPYVRTFFQEVSMLNDDDMIDRIHSKRDEYESLVEDALRRGRELGLFDLPQGERTAGLFLFGACNWSYQWFREEGAMDIDQLVDIWFSLTMYGLRGPESARRGGDTRTSIDSRTR